jgi:hypothetical protein
MVCFSQQKVDIRQTSFAKFTDFFAGVPVPNLPHSLVGTNTGQFGQKQVHLFHSFFP